jgi:hypothetical protein
MSTWNYRVLEFRDPTTEQVWCGIFAVYYTEDGKPESYAEEPAAVCWDADEHPAVPAAQLAQMARALKLPNLREVDFGIPADGGGEG